MSKEYSSPDSEKYQKGRWTYQEKIRYVVFVEKSQHNPMFKPHYEYQLYIIF